LQGRGSKQAASLPISRDAFKLLEPLSPFFFSFPEFETGRFVGVDDWFAFPHSSSSTRHFIKGASMPNEVPFKPTWHGRYHQGAPIMNGSRLRNDNLCEIGMVSLVVLPKIAGVGICGGKKLEQRTHLPDSGQRSFSRANPMPYQHARALKITMPTLPSFKYDFAGYCRPDETSSPILFPPCTTS
jgi:hypothetical protein